jgi:hypothetical protein
MASPVLYDGITRQFENDPDFGMRPSSIATSFTLTPGVTSVGNRAFFETLIGDLACLKNSAVTSIGDHAFFMCPLTTLKDLPPGLLTIASGAFDSNHYIENLHGIPFSAEVDENAFGSPQYSNDSGECILLLEKARILGFTGRNPINEWVQDRKNVPARRLAIYASVLVARKQENEAVTNAVTPLLAGIAKLPDDMIREIVGFAHGDHLLESVGLSPRNIWDIKLQKARRYGPHAAEQALWAEFDAHGWVINDDEHSDHTEGGYTKGG